jgi:hypothetical protein
MTSIVSSSSFFINYLLHSLMIVSTHWYNYEIEVLDDGESFIEVYIELTIIVTLR